MKKIFCIMLAALALVACNRQKGLTIEADCSSSEEGFAWMNDVSGWVYFTALGGSEKLDSAYMENGSFSLHVDNLDPNEVYELNVRPVHFKEFIFAEEGKLHLQLAGDILTGTPLAEEVSRVFCSLNDVSSEEEYVGTLKTAFEQHQADPAGAVFLYYLAFEVPVEEALAMYEGASDAVKNTTCMKTAVEGWQKQVVSSAGHPFIDFEVECDGKTTRLSDYVGGGRKLTVVDFWASWCGPCKREIPYLIDVYNRYHAQGVEVVGVATWDEPAATLEAIDKLAIPYPQIINAQRLGSDAYGIEGIPEILLIGEDGMILARGLRGEGIEEAVLANLK